MIFTKTCKYCHGTGDYRGEYGKKQPDYRSEKNRCLHCNGQGFTSKDYRSCKYCGDPIESGYACDSCLREFEKEVEQEGMKVEACKICDNNHDRCKFACNCSELVEVGGDEPKLTPEQQTEVKKLLHYVEDIKIADAVYFPKPQAIYKELPVVLMGPKATDYMKAWQHNGLMIIASVGKYEDGLEWLHLSVSRKSRIPSYEDITRVKRDFIGEDRKAITVLPEKKYHVNLHENCLHLFYSADNPLPEFSAGLGTI